jgi:hypothetical protein
MDRRVVESRLEELFEEAIAAEKARIEALVRETADRVLAARLEQPSLDDPDDPWLTREEAMEEFEVPYWKVRDLEVSGKVPVRRSGRNIVARRSDLAAHLAA